MPRLRTTGSAITRSASRKIGNASASTSDSSSSRWRVMAPIRICPCPARRRCSRARREIVDVDEVLEVGEAELHHRQQAVAARHEPRRAPGVPAARWPGRRWSRVRTRTVPELACLPPRHCRPSVCALSGEGCQRQAKGLLMSRLRPSPRQGPSSTRDCSGLPQSSRPGRVTTAVKSTGHSQQISPGTRSSRHFGATTCLSSRVEPWELELRRSSGHPFSH